jgi:chromosome segregation ATPase
MQNPVTKDKTLNTEQKLFSSRASMSDPGDCAEFEDDLLKLKSSLPVSFDSTDEQLNAEVVQAGEMSGLDGVLVSRLSDLLSGLTARKRLCRFATDKWKEEALGLESVLDHLMKSRRELDDRVTELELDESSLREEVKQARELGENINEECQMIQDELERLTQVLFEEVNLMVSTEARAKHQELASTQELESEIQRVREKLAVTSRRFNALKAKMTSSGKLMKHLSESRIVRSRNSFSNRPLSYSGSTKALDEILQKNAKE